MDDLGSRRHLLLNSFVVISQKYKLRPSKCNKSCYIPSTTKASYMPVSLRHSHSFRMLRKKKIFSTNNFFYLIPDRDSFKKMIFSILNIEKVSVSFIGLRFSGQLCEDKYRSLFSNPFGIVFCMSH